MAYWKEALVVLVVLLECGDISACPARCECTEDHVVNCGYQRLTSLPQNIPEDAVNLYLHHNNLQYVPRGAFRNLRRLEGLALTYNRVSQIEPGAFEGLTNLQSLYLGYNLLTNISG
ncbi:PREDICTED: immunoglobulin superfamily containing leucine-rich repeat protein-like [Branchiostoma belcheri]|uniref:Immunoglobulin superfamily containing leucine-rich repeat protein-like n=1 Tax=Branchiostoma belcheri TaxID=7741 RepID=A0A6P4Z648_BRABE|nr:PREDICTED: immunoglobulin superfamily containing leucine-rich repeat protein-like [Branchiostoma belcheri]